MGILALLIAIAASAAGRELLRHPGPFFFFSPKLRRCLSILLTTTQQQLLLPWAEMRRACVLRQLGRCADSTLPPGSTTSCRASGAGLLRRELRGRGALGTLPHTLKQLPHSCTDLINESTDTHSNPFTTARTRPAPWKVSPPSPPSVHPHAHAHPHAPANTTFDAPTAPVEPFRSVMRLLPSSVVVCTSADAESIPRGMTMSSFTSLSLHPVPLITFNIALPSRTLEAIAQSREFNIHVLSGDGEGARVADWFRRGNASDRGVFEAGRMRDGCGCEAVQQGQEGRGAAPLLRGKGVLYGLKCKLLDDEPNRGLVRARDHVVVLAEVREITEGRGEQPGQEVFGLAYADRRYRQLGATIVQEEG